MAMKQFNFQSLLSMIVVATLIAGCTSMSMKPDSRQHIVKEGSEQPLTLQKSSTGQLKAQLLGIPGDSEIIGTKLFTKKNYDGVKNDGETAFTLTDLHITFYHLRARTGGLSTIAVADFILANRTQNDKGEHHHFVNIHARGQSGNILGPNSLRIELQRDTCTPGNPVSSGSHQYQLDIFDQVDGATINWDGSWTYEGKC